MTTFREAPDWGTKRTLCRRSINPRPHQCKANRIINRETAAGLAMAAEIIPRPHRCKANRITSRGTAAGLATAAETAITVAGMSTAEATATMAEAITAGIIIRRAA